MKKYIIPIVIILTISLVTLERTSGKKQFKQNAGKQIENHDIRTIIVNPAMLNASNEKYFLLQLGNSNHTEFLNFTDTLKTSFESLADKDVLHRLDKAEGYIILSGEYELCSRAFVVLRQLGFNNIKILSGENDPEVLKYEFRSDTIVRPEF